MDGWNFSPMRNLGGNVSSVCHRLIQLVRSVNPVWVAPAIRRDKKDGS